MECKKLIKADPNKSTASEKKEAASSSYEALAEFFPGSYYNRFLSLTVDLMQDILKGNKNYPRNVTIEYDMLTRFELASPRRHHTKRTGYKVNREIVGVVVEGVIYSSNTPHHRVQSLFQISTAALNIILTVSILRSGDIMIISAQNPRETGRQIT